MNVLIVDDEREVCVWTERILQIAKVMVTNLVCASTLEEGLQIAASLNPPNLTLLDLSMKETGAEQAIDAVPIFSKYGPVIIVTGSYVTEADKIFVRAIENGAYDFLFKPDALKLGNEARLAKSIALATLLWRREHGSAKP